MNFAKADNDPKCVHNSVTSLNHGDTAGLLPRLPAVPVAHRDIPVLSLWATGTDLASLWPTGPELFWASGP